jgi:hypothetical protein
MARKSVVDRQMRVWIDLSMQGLCRGMKDEDFRRKRRRPRLSQHVLALYHVNVSREHARRAHSKLINKSIERLVLTSCRTKSYQQWLNLSAGAFSVSMQVTCRWPKMCG